MRSRWYFFPLKLGKLPRNYSRKPLKIAREKLPRLRPAGEFVKKIPANERVIACALF